MRLKDLRSMFTLKAKVGFNSIKVRLKAWFNEMIARTNFVFQFHKGAIKSKIDIKIGGSTARFNSIKVRLKDKRTLNE